MSIKPESSSQNTNSDIKQLFQSMEAGASYYRYQAEPGNDKTWFLNS